MTQSPSLVCLSMSNWLLSSLVQHLQPGSKINIVTMNTAAGIAGTVTDAQMNAYIQYTTWRWSTYVMHNAFTT